MSTFMMLMLSQQLHFLGGGGGGGDVGCQWAIGHSGQSDTVVKGKGQRPGWTSAAQRARKRCPRFVDESHPPARRTE